MRLVRQSQLLDFSLALGTLLPALLRAFVAADVDVGRGEHVAEFGEDRLEEVERLGVAAAEHLAHHAPIGSNLIGAARAAQVGEDVQGTLHVARHVYLGHHVDVALCCITHHLAAVILRVVAAVGDVVVDAHPARTDDRLLPHAAFLCQLGQRLHLEAPALVLGQVPVELVAAVQGHRIQELLDELHAEEVAPAVEQNTAIAEAGLVGNRGERHLHALPLAPCSLPLAPCSLPLNHRHALAQRLCGTEQAHGLEGTQQDAAFADGQGVALLFLFRKGDRLLLALLVLCGRRDKGQSQRCRLAVGRQLQSHSGCLLHPLLHELRDAGNLGIAAVVGNPHVLLQGERLRGVGLHLLREGNNVVVGPLCSGNEGNEAG